MKTLKDFIDEYSAKGVELSFVSNYPWVYLNDVNGELVKEKRDSEHGYVVSIYNFKGETFVKGGEELRELISKYSKD